jgi:DNA-binding response OmpR family regulator
MTIRKKIIWILEDDQALGAIIRETLEAGYALKMFHTVQSMLEALDNIEQEGHLVAETLPDLILADLKLPDDSFLSVINSRTKGGSQFYIPFVILSGVDDVDVMRHCFSRGALDYLTKPFKKSELIVKIENVFQELSEDLYSPRKEQFFVDPVTLRVHFMNKISSPLTSKEMQILALFRLSTEKAVTRGEMVSRVWNDISVSTKTLDVHLFNLRRKLLDAGLEIVFSHPNIYRLVKTSTITPKDTKEFEFRSVHRDAKSEAERLEIPTKLIVESKIDSKNKSKN